MFVALDAKVISTNILIWTEIKTSFCLLFCEYIGEVELFAIIFRFNA